MADEAYWADLRPVLQDMADRIARIEQFLASSGLQAPTSGSSFAAAGGTGDFFDSAPASFGPASFGPASASSPPLSGPQPGVLPDDILLLARSGKKIQAINEFRKRTGMSLKEAKAIIDQAAHGY
ncbi:MAG TPA: hypothetical protein VN695_05305 [Streptosporangiaceae bacterium]|nr:hypothetical protein [Streptosporangiaceae bacterium]